MKAAKSHLYREILRGITEETTKSGQTPYEAYVTLQAEAGRYGLGRVAYLSSAITSGGHARDAELKDHIGTVIARNTASALLMAEGLYESRQLDPTSSIEAVALGAIPGWRQSDYMTFWLMVMSGLPSTGVGVAQTAKKFEHDFERELEKAEVDMSVYNDSKLPPEERVRQYFHHAQVFASVATEGYELDPVKKLVRLVDPQTSLGAQTEKVFAGLLDISTYNVSFAALGSAPQVEGGLPERLVHDADRLVAFGAHVFSLERRQMLVLVPEAETAA